MTDKPSDSPAERPSRLVWWLHPKVALPLTVVVLLVLSPFLYRAYRISRVPDIGDPFDVAAFEAETIAAGDNAVECYEAANVLRRSVSIPPEDLEHVFEDGWSSATEPIQKWLTANEPALDEWRRGTERPTFLCIPPKSVRIDMLMPLINDLRDFSRLARLRAERCLYDGDLVGAWDWLRASVRCSRHLGQHGVAVERLVGISFFINAAQGINRWAADPHVDNKLLQKAAAELNADDAMTPLPSVALKCEYLVLLHTLESNLPWETFLMTSGIFRTSVRTRVPDRLFPSLLFVKGEPEGSLRLTQQAFANWLEQSDLPRWKRTKLASRFGFRTPPSKPGRLSAPELESLIMSFDLARSWLPALSQFEEAVDREAARRAALRLTLAAQRHRRQHGDWPAKLEDLVPDFIDKLPADPFGKSGESLRLKRDGDELLIYSLGPNEVDDGGKVEHDHGSPLDEGFRVKPPE